LFRSLTLFPIFVSQVLMVPSSRPQHTRPETSLPLIEQSNVHDEGRAACGASLSIVVLEARGLTNRAKAAIISKGCERSNGMLQPEEPVAQEKPER
jgi:hypothetical protein